MEETETLKRTALYEAHEAAGAKLVPFAGYEMPVQYVGVKEEHLAVRECGGIFDVSHMGEIETVGPDAEVFLQHILSNDVTKLAERGAQYSVICREDGGIIDDLFTYKLASDRYLTVTNAANHEKDFDWVHEQAESFDVDVIDRHDSYAMIAAQGPQARQIVGDLADGDLPARMMTAEIAVAGVNALVCGTGYTGEDGVEVLVDPHEADVVWDALVERGLAPTGLAARDTLRLEVCYHLYGNDMDESRNPIEAALGWACKDETGFIGSDVVTAARNEGTSERLVAFKLTGPGIARSGNEIVGGGAVTSGTLSPSLGFGIGLAYVPSERAEIGTEFEIDVRGKVRPAVVVKKPIYKKEQ